MQNRIQREWKMTQVRRGVEEAIGGVSGAILRLQMGTRHGWNDKVRRRRNERIDFDWFCRARVTATIPESDSLGIENG